MKKHYLLRERIPESAHRELAEFPELVRHLLFHRGITARREAKLFLDGEHLEHDAALLSDAARAVSRIEKAIKNKERIVVWSDYDTDGIPGGVLLREAIRAAGADKENVRHIIPHRNIDGFGLNARMIDECAAGGVGLMVTVDCGSVNATEIKHANEVGIDVIVTDHHTLNDERPEAFALVNPLLNEYPNKALCGAGVAFKIGQLLLSHFSLEVRAKWESEAYPLVGLATLSDMVSLVGENRTLAQKGLSALRKTNRPGLTALFRRTNLSQAFLREDDITFTISPRLNAASRIDEPEIARDVLAAETPAEAEALAERLEHLNHERRGHVAAMVKDVHHRLSASEVPSVIVIGDPRWQPGLVGLVANTLAEHYKRPAFVWGRGVGETIKGSCRGDGSLSVVSLMEAANEHFLEYGGHENSGGFSVSAENIHTLADALIRARAACESEVRTKDETLFADARISLRDVTWERFHEINCLAPFGVGNPKPIFLLEGIHVDAVRVFGKGKEHATLVLSDGNATHEAIRFFADDAIKGIQPGSAVSFAAALESSHFRGRPELRLRILDVL